MQEVKVNATSSYSVHIGHGIIDEAVKLIKPLTRTETVVIVTDDVVEELYLNKLSDMFIAANYDVKVFVMQNGESNKSLENYGHLLRYMADEGVTRADTVIAFGGGVTGDLAGFAASTYMRGVNFINIPTTLLAGIDSSIGGKTAVDLPEGKNLVGTFYQPKAVVFDLDFLKTLPENEFKNGLGELIKCGVLAGGELWEILCGGENSLTENLERAVTLAVEYKRDIVVADEHECGVRRLLNLGHTLAHGIEKLSNFAVPHGEAVAMGLKMTAEAAYKHKTLTKTDYQSICTVMDAFGIKKTSGFDIGQLIETARVDKKVEGKNINLVTITAVGKCEVQKLPLAKLEEFYNGCQA